MDVKKIPLARLFFLPLNRVCCSKKKLSLYPWTWQFSVDDVNERCDKMIQYKRTKEISDADLRVLYTSVNWLSYTDKVENLSLLITNSQTVVSAWEDDRLIGLIRTVGDGLSIQYVQDILIMPEYQKQGIGTALIKQILDESKHIRQLVLITDGSKENQGIIKWYKKMGLSVFEDIGLIGLYRR